MTKITLLLLLLITFGCSHVSIQEHEALKKDLDNFKNQAIAADIYYRENTKAMQDKIDWLWDFHRDEIALDKLEKKEAIYGPEAFSPAHTCRELYNMAKEAGGKGIKISIIMSDLRKIMGNLETENGAWECVENKLKRMQQ